MYSTLYSVHLQLLLKAQFFINKIFNDLNQTNVIWPFIIKKYSLIQRWFFFERVLKYLFDVSFINKNLNLYKNILFYCAVVKYSIVISKTKYTNNDTLYAISIRTFWSYLTLKLIRSNPNFFQMSSWSLCVF